MDVDPIAHGMRLGRGEDMRSPDLNVTGYFPSSHLRNASLRKVDRGSNAGLQLWR